MLLFEEINKKIASLQYKFLRIDTDDACNFSIYDKCRAQKVYQAKAFKEGESEDVYIYAKRLTAIAI
jgi:hypothetical protein